VKGTGPDGRVTETDVRAAAKSKGAAQRVPAASVKAGERTDSALGYAQIIAQRLVESLGRFRISISTSISTLARSWPRA
jgi:pyruvate/2-oxoglutarate dehydrogenase complex dihydrolipoamide acyltransferase (E2) component